MRKDRTSAILRFLIRCGFILALFVVIFRFILGVRVQDGNGMFPFVLDGDVVLYYRVGIDTNVGTAVVYRAGGHSGIARIAAKGGDTVDIDSGGTLLVNGAPVTRNVFFATEKDRGKVSYPYEVPEGAFFLLHDEREEFGDSRTFGAIPRGDITGTVLSLVRRRGI